MKSLALLCLLAIYLTILTLAQVPVGENDFLITNTTGPSGFTGSADSSAIVYNPDLNEYFVAFSANQAVGTLVASKFEIYGQRLSGVDGSRIGDPVRISFMGLDSDARATATDPDVCYNATQEEYVVVWEADSPTESPESLVDNEFEIFGRQVRATTLELLGSQRRVSAMGSRGDASYDAHTPAITWNSNENEYMVVWSGDHYGFGLVEGEMEIFGQRFRAPFFSEIGLINFPISQAGGVDGSTLYEAVAPDVTYNSSNNEYLVVWEGEGTVNNEFEIFGQRLGSNGATEGDNFRISTMGFSASPLYEAADPAATYNPFRNEYFVVWSGDDNRGGLVNNEHEIHGQRLSGFAGLPVGQDEFRISFAGSNGDTTIDAMHPAVVLNTTNNEYLVTWEVNFPVSGEFTVLSDIYGVRLDYDGSRLTTGSDTRISNRVLGSQAEDPVAWGHGSTVAWNSQQEEYLVAFVADAVSGPAPNYELEIMGQRLKPGLPEFAIEEIVVVAGGLKPGVIVRFPSEEKYSYALLTNTDLRGWNFVERETFSGAPTLSQLTHPNGHLAPRRFYHVVRELRDF